MLNSLMLNPKLRLMVTFHHDDDVMTGGAAMDEGKPLSALLNLQLPSRSLRRLPFQMPARSLVCSS